jgi:hypothetical protein
MFQWFSDTSIPPSLRALRFLSLFLPRSCFTDFRDQHWFANRPTHFLLHFGSNAHSHFAIAAISCQCWSRKYVKLERGMKKDAERELEVLRACRHQKTIEIFHKLMDNWEPDDRNLCFWSGADQIPFVGSSGYWRKRPFFGNLTVAQRHDRGFKIRTGSPFLQCVFTSVARKYCFQSFGGLWFFPFFSVQQGLSRLRSSKVHALPVYFSRICRWFCGHN